MIGKSLTAIVSKQQAPSLSGRKGSFVGHWSESYCPQGRQIGPVKPHCQSDWNWFVVLLLQHPIKRRTLGGGREWVSALMVPVRHGGADGWHRWKWLLALGQLDNAQTSRSSRWNKLGWFWGPIGVENAMWTLCCHWWRPLRFSLLKSVLISSSLLSQYRKCNHITFLFSVFMLTGLQDVWWFCFWVKRNGSFFQGTTCSPCWLAVKIMAVFPCLLFKLSVEHLKEMRSEVALNSYILKCLLSLVDASIDTLVKVLLA